MIGDRLRTCPEVLGKDKTYIFWGFQHLNAQQIDLLKILSTSCDLIIPIPSTIRASEKRSDWISWVKDFDTKIEELPLITCQPKASWIPINTREISRSLKSLIQDGDQVLLGVSKLSPSHMNIIPWKNVFFKIPLEILSDELGQLHSEIEKFSGTLAELSSFLDKKIQSTLNLKILRAIQLYKESLSFVLEMTDEAIVIDSFFVKLLSDVTKLNQPRTSFIPLSSEKTLVELKDISSLEDINLKRRVILCIDDRFDGMQSLGQSYSESIQKTLSSIGPIKRSDLDFLFKEWELKNLFNQAQVFVLMNEEILKHHLNWKKFFKEVELLKIDKPSFELKENLLDKINLMDKSSFNGTLSASKIQMFIDCPKKFYFTYVDKIFPEILLEKDLDPLSSGSLIHEIIEKFFKEMIKDEDLGALVKMVMEAYLSKKNISMTYEIYLQRELLFSHRSMNGINFIRKINEISEELINWKFEESFKIQSEFLLNGRIDCLGIAPSTIYLLDFKSTAMSASSTKEVMDFEAIQLWAYVVASKQLIPGFDQKKLVIGYVVLDDTTSSQLLTWDDDLYDLFRDADFSKVQKIKNVLNLVETETKLCACVQNIMNEKIFPPKPRKKNVCDFCDLNRVCFKSETPYVQDPQ
jgi:hypothetical protein